MMKTSLVDCSVRGLTTLPYRSLRLAATASAAPDAQRRNFNTANRGGKRPETSKAQPVFCSHTSAWLLSTFAPELRSETAPTKSRNLAHARCITTQSAVRSAAASQAAHDVAPQSAQDKHHLLGLVGNGDESSADEHFDFHRDPYRRGYATPDNTTIQISENTRDVEYPSSEETFKPSPETRRILYQLKLGINKRLRHHQRGPLDTIYKLYNQLPEPRMLQITARWRGKLLRVMGLPKKRNSDSMMQYFALVADVKSAGLTLTRAQWNFAIAYAAKYATRASRTEMESTMRLWRDMEKGADIKGNYVTFNLLFDVAAKAGNFALAEMIYKEMDNRGIEFNRFHHVTLIHYFGLRLDSGGVRAAYKEMVEAGEMVDTLTLNAVIAGLLRCGEEDAADETYQRMRNSQPLLNTVHKPPKAYSTGKAITKALMMFSRLAKQHPEMKGKFQSGVDISPDLRTYKLLIDHYAVRLGDLSKVAQCLDEMKQSEIRVHPTIFLAIFKGFTAHGGFPGSEWSYQRLRGVLSALFQSYKEAPNDFKIEHWLVLWTLRAVHRCGSSENVVETFQDLSKCWSIPDDRLAQTQTFFEFILEGKDSRATQRSLEGNGHHSA